MSDLKNIAKIFGILFIIFGWFFYEFRLYETDDDVKKQILDEDFCTAFSVFRKDFAFSHKVFSFQVWTCSKPSLVKRRWSATPGSGCEACLDPSHPFGRLLPVGNRSTSPASRRLYLDQGGGNRRLWYSKTDRTDVRKNLLQIKSHRFHKFTQIFMR